MVLGMHRSGTSALTRALGLLGAAMPRTPIAPSPANEAGYWEPASIVAVQDEILASVGSSWDDLRPFPQDWFGTDAARAYANRLAGLVSEEFGDAPLAVLKDPRLCRLVPLWRQVLRLAGADPVYVLALRHPAEVAASLEARDGMMLERALLLWLDYLLTAERETRGQPRAIIHYDDILKAPEASLRSLAAALALPPPVTMESDTVGVPSARYRHHQAGPASGMLGGWVERVYGCLLGRRQLDAQAEAVFDAVRSEMATAQRYFLPVIAQAAAPRAVEQACLAAALDTHKQELAQLAQRTVLQAQDLQRLQAQYTEQRRLIEALSHRRSGLGAILRRLKHKAACPPRLHRTARLIRASGLFDETWYRQAYPDVAASVTDPVLHYLRFGAQEGRWPNKWFNTQDYLSRHPELKASGINPFLHYVQSSARHE